MRRTRLQREADKEIMAEFMGDCMGCEGGRVGFPGSERWEFLEELKHQVERNGSIGGVRG